MGSNFSQSKFKFCKYSDPLGCQTTENLQEDTTHMVNRSELHVRGTTVRYKDWGDYYYFH